MIYLHLSVRFILWLQISHILLLWLIHNVCSTCHFSTGSREFPALCTFKRQWTSAVGVSPLPLALTLLFVYSDDDHALVAAYADELVDGADTSTWQLAQEDHALDVVVLQKADVGAHLGDGPHVHHYNILHLWEPVLVKSTAEPRHCWRNRNKEGKCCLQILTQLVISL